MADWITEITGWPAVLGNDADVAGLAEALFGAGKGLSPIFYITIGSGIGGGLIINGEIYRGCGRGAAEATVPRALRRKEGSGCADAPPSEREARSAAAVAATASASTTGALPNGSARTSPIPSEAEAGRSFERADNFFPRARANAQGEPSARPRFGDASYLKTRDENPPDG